MGDPVPLKSYRIKNINNHSKKMKYWLEIFLYGNREKFTTMPDLKNKIKQSLHYTIEKSIFLFLKLNNETKYTGKHPKKSEVILSIEKGTGT